MSELDQIKRAMADGAHTDGDLQWAVDEIERLAVELNLYRTGKVYSLAAEEIERLQARVEALDKVRIAVLKHRDNEAFLNVNTWNACVSAAERDTEQEKQNEQ